MSDYRAVAAVTATLQNLLQPAVTAAVDGATVRPARPDKFPAIASTGEVHLYLYQVSPNPAFRNVEVPVRRADGTLVRRPQLALDLHYLVSFYGDESRYIPQLLLGAVASKLHAEPNPRPQDLPGRPLGDQPDLSGSGLAQQIDKLRFVPLPLGHDDLSKLWSIFFQVPYTLSAAYLCSVVLIEPDLAPQPPALPPLQPPFDRVRTAPPPQLERAEPQKVAAGGEITLEGHQLQAAGLQVVVDDEHQVEPRSVSPTAVRFALPAGLGVGTHTARVTRPSGTGGSRLASNPVPFLLQPQVVDPPAYLPAESGGTDPQPAALSVRVAPPVTVQQTVEILLTERDPDPEGPAQGYTLRLPPGSAGERLEVPIPQVASGTYLLRVAVDGLTSALAVGPDPDHPRRLAYTGPEVVIP